MFRIYRSTISPHFSSEVACQAALVSQVDDRYWDVMASTFSKVAEVLQLSFGLDAVDAEWADFLLDSKDLECI